MQEEERAVGRQQLLTGCPGLKVQKELVPNWTNCGFVVGLVDTDWYILIQLVFAGPTNFLNLSIKITFIGRLMLICLLVFAITNLLWRSV